MSKDKNKKVNNKKKTFKDVAYDILYKYDKGDGLHSDEITKLALKEGILVTEGSTPELTMNSVIITDINEKDNKSRFIKTGPSKFSINKNWVPKKEEVKLVSERLAPISNKNINIDYKNTKYKTNTYLEAAKQILEEAKQCLHYKDITEKAIKKGLLKVKGRAPWSVLTAVIGRDDINKKGSDSVFVRGDIPGYICLRSFSKKVEYKKYDNKQDSKKKIETVVKGSVAESRIIELLSLYGKKDFVCYRPSPDIEGIDLIVKEKDRFEPIYLQVKSTFGYGTKKGFVSSIRQGKMFREDKMIVVFAYFDLTEGDITDYIYCVPMPDFMRLKDEVGRKKIRVFTASIDNRREDSPWSPYLIEKRELSDRIAEILEETKNEPSNSNQDK